MGWHKSGAKSRRENFSPEQNKSGQDECETKNVWSASFISAWKFLSCTLPQLSPDTHLQGSDYSYLHFQLIIPHQKIKYESSLSPSGCMIIHYNSGKEISNCKLPMSAVDQNVLKTWGCFHLSFSLSLSLSLSIHLHLLNNVHKGQWFFIFSAEPLWHSTTIIILIHFIFHPDHFSLPTLGNLVNHNSFSSGILLFLPFFFSSSFEQCPSFRGWRDK